MRYILYDRNFTKNRPIYRISVEGMSKEQFVSSWIECESTQITYLNNLVLTDLDTFFKIATSAQREVVRECLEIEMWHNDCLPF